MESYVPRLDEATSEAISVRIGSVVAELREEGSTLRWVRSFALAREETYLCVFVAADAAEIAAANERAGLDYDHVNEVVVFEPRRLA